MKTDQYNALLLVGPTGSGKTPLGRYLEEHGLNNRACVHFDFGENLRNVARNGHPSVSEDDRLFLEDVLHRGALLENETFYLAEAVFGAFVEDRQVGKDDLVVLNGLPRHLDQAKDTDRLVTIQTLVHLVCTPEGVCRRISQNTGRDRTGRVDDTPEQIARKIAIFNSRTLPLIDYYHGKGATVCRVEASVDVTPSDMASRLVAGIR
ncbi:nucleoside monophosphate kinase [Desulfosudis oleivorans]|uniref:Adenylate kinase n=1 Tax=Desulfosudis oleivorans (strain DSM 6200 / JCM 39069 / Hxd3) TaxID=96561 RepID=A8ZXJ4_DESOH|nr:nucleoside monophosphate kinase [Desulfosudis oleivorans]ABW66952.1 Adenylate kinase and related kinase-like protein [Desulfosudis oleivorans Hxd3]